MAKATVCNRMPWVEAAFFGCFYAVCNCKWRGPQRHSEDEAWEDAWEHLHNLRS